MQLLELLIYLFYVNLDCNPFTNSQPERMWQNVQHFCILKFK